MGHKRFESAGVVFPGEEHSEFEQSDRRVYN